MNHVQMALGIRRQDRLLAAASAALLIAVMSGLFVTGSGNLFWWMASPFALLGMVGFYLARMAGSPPRGRRAGAHTGRAALFTLSAGCTVALTWLAAHRRPLPLLDLGAAALVTVLFALVCIVVVWSALRLSLLSFPMLFLAVTFLFTCSPLILYQTEGYDAFQYWRFLDLDSVQLGLPVLMLAFAAFTAGALLAPSVRPHNSLPAADPEEEAIAGIVRAVGFYLYLLSILLVVAATLRGSALSLAYEGGYQDFAGTRRTGEMSRLIVASMSWFMPWSLLILTATSRTRRMYMHTLILAVPAVVIMLLGGARAAPLSMMLMLASGGHLRGFSVDWRPALALAVLVLLLLTTTVNLRNTPIRDWTPSLIYRAATNQVEESRAYNQSLLTGVLIANSTSYQVLAGTMYLVPNTEPYRYGLDYLKAVGTAVPFGHLLFAQIGISLRDGEPSDWLKGRISPTTWSGLGYLQVAEAYLQFGAFGVAGLYLVLGYVVTWLWRRVDQQRVDARRLALILLLVMSLLIWVRNDGVSLTRPLIWGWLLIFVLPAWLDIHRRKRVFTAQPAPYAVWNQQDSDL